MNFNPIFLQSQPIGGSNSFFIIWLVAIVFIFYFFFMRPQAKKAKEQQKFRDSLAKGDRIVTNGGIHGRVLKVEEGSSSILVEVDSNTKLRIEKSAISAELSNLEEANNNA